MKNRKHIKIPLPNWSWWQFGLVMFIIINSFNIDITSITDILNLVKLFLP